MNTTTTQETTMDTTVYTNTSAVASIDGDDLSTIHASEMADCLGAYTRSVALVVDRASLYVLRRALTEAANLGDTDKNHQRAADHIVAAINDILERGLR